MKRLVLLTASLLWLLYGCTDTAVDEEMGANRLAQGFVDLEFHRLPNTRISIDNASKYHEPLDSDSIEMYAYRGDTAYHPHRLAVRCQEFLAAYRQTEDSTYLNRAGKYADKIMSLCDVIDGRAFFPISFAYKVHADTSISFKSPWYSGMAQGELLSGVVRMYEICGDEKYLDFAHLLFNSLALCQGQGEPWVARVDSAGYYWIEEYPHEIRPGRTLNGFIAALYGVYDYYRVTNCDEAKAIYEMSLTTLKEHIPYYRRESATSLYCLGHMIPATKGYHETHISMFLHLRRMTDDPFFGAMAQVFASDSGAN